ncbi:MAG: MucB/RseB C-terminal domain-containing protein [Thiotrichales bacterium]
MIPRLVAAALFYMLTHTALANDGGARQLLEKMLAAEQYLNFEGTFVYLSGPKVETLQVIHSFDKNGERERLTSTAGSSEELVRDDKRMLWVSPARKVVLIESLQNRETSRGAASIPDPFRQPGGYYDLTLGGTERVADHLCQTVSIYPKDQFRYGFRLCIEQESGLLLKAQTVDKAGQPREQMMFTSISLPDSIATERLQTSVPKDDFAVLQARDDDAGKATPAINPDWTVVDLPPGFLITRNSMRHVASSALPVQHIVLDDGLATLSVFIAKSVPGEPYTAGILQSGALSAFSRKVDDYVVTVVGEVPALTAQRVGVSVSRNRVQ